MIDRHVPTDRDVFTDSDVPPPVPETEPEIPPPHRPVPDVPLTEPRPNEPPTRILPGTDSPPAPDAEPEPV